MGSKITHWALRLWTLGVMFFLLAPLVVIIVYAFNESNIQSFPIHGFSLKWVVAAWHNEEIFAALGLSLKIALLATVISVLLGTTAAFVVDRYRFFGRETVSFIVVLPIALPGVITGIALGSYFEFFDISLSYWTIVIGHVTFCIVIVYNNVIARMRRLPGSLREASMDLGAGPFRTFYRITLPLMSTALLSGALLAFALSFNEVIVTNFTAGAQNTLPLWIFGALRLGQNLPVVNVVVSAVVIVMLALLLLCYWLMTQAGTKQKEHP
ncbi:ABC transporter permease [Marinobacter antarcticus]|uniref:ABC transporter permease n=1 Tax=Marinobacter antarcticus TaxID=564117 RepID=A0A831R7A4_9GAMM|nr:ABC transporter permease [Marinobacter antarcticus]HEA53680.1 ABC transporter permease [Marinobacter antarcticus]